MFQSLVTMATSMQQADDNSELSEQQTRSFQSEPQASKAHQQSLFYDVIIDFERAKCSRITLFFTSHILRKLLFDFKITLHVHLNII